MNSQETILNQSNVNVSSFGKLFTMSVDGDVYTQPLYVPGLSIPGIGTRNVIYVATENNKIYAFDADNYTTDGSGAKYGIVLWSVNLGQDLSCFGDIPSCNRDILYNIGVTSTPVIDVGRNTIYVVAENRVSPAGASTLVSKFVLHALNLTTGAEQRGSPVTITGSVPGTGDSSNGTTVSFVPAMHWQRPALTLVNGNVYIGFGSHQDTRPYHGWIFGYDGLSLRQVVVKNLSPNGTGAAVWQSGNGFVADSSGNIYLETGNGTTDAWTGGSDFGMAAMKLNAIGGLDATGYFVPSNEASLNSADKDFGSGSPLLIPGTNYLVAAGKDGRVFVLDTTNLGGFNNTTDKVVQEWTASVAFFSANVYYNGYLYTWGRNDYLKMWAYTGNSTAPFSTTPYKTGTSQIPFDYSNTAAMSISANGTTPGSGIVWATYSLSSAGGAAYPQIFHALSADDVTVELWNSSQNFSRDNPGSWAKFCPPTVINGKVYVATFDGAVNVYGLLQ